MRLYLICGKANTGKNLFAEYLKKEFENKNLKVCLLKITEPLYGYAKNHFGWNGLEEDKPREFLQTMGIELIQKELGWEYFLIDRLSEDITILNKFFDIGIITDGRLIKEFDELKRRYSNIKFIKLERNNYTDNLTFEEKKHITEIDLDNNYNYDYIVENTSIDKLIEDARNIVLKEGDDNNE